MVWVKARVKVWARSFKVRLSVRVRLRVRVRVMTRVKVKARLWGIANFAFSPLDFFGSVLESCCW